MKHSLTLLTVSLLLLSISASAATCEFIWDEDPSAHTIEHYTVYKDSLLFETDIKSTTYQLPCIIGSYTLTATDNYNVELPESYPVTITDNTQSKSFMITAGVR